MLILGLGGTYGHHCPWLSHGALLRAASSPPTSRARAKGAARSASSAVGTAVLHGSRAPIHMASLISVLALCAQ